ncbi:hypothetical protein TUN199_01628 [Pyrenophora tritici-repentis]|nr:hypothetical protein A1F99_115810 [Pyrenophora tritici-repentis]KAI0578508.1 hypothetical protein Alg130_07902 [Pyrenophora tritici-repentis]KAI0579367.1 hypothetical protein Alg215_05802 [Pyrenophora tritici-repentis]KAI0614255.1 hypothetical protein TUN205_01444 [Pyrenophora tritici-repentis]KAI0626319.1 hypothetical protein TUN199_01628 [Pyrenophora tritici-repentis]
MRARVKRTSKRRKAHKLDYPKSDEDTAEESEEDDDDAAVAAPPEEEDDDDDEEEDAKPKATKPSGAEKDRKVKTTAKTDPVPGG